MARRRPWFKLLLTIVILTATVIVTSALWLRWLGYGLIHDEGPAKADIAVVAAGDSWGHRVETAAGLVKAGYVPAVLVSGPPIYGVHECDLAIAMMVRKGFPAAWFIPFPNETLSTREESVAILGELRRRGVRRFLLVTSSYHSARAARIYRATERAVGGPPFRTVAAPDQYFRPESWWRNREGQKTVFIEWMKTAAGALGM